MTKSRAQIPILSTRAAETEAATEHVLWKQRIRGKLTAPLHPDVEYDGDLELVYNSATRRFAMRAEVRKPTRVTATRPVAGDGEEYFRILVAACWHKVSGWRHAGSRIAFTYDCQVFYGGWKRLFLGPVSGTIPNLEKAEASYREMLESLDPTAEPLEAAPEEAAAG